jgi:serralysin
MKYTLRACVLSTLILSACAPAENPEPLTWEEFSTSVEREAETGMYIVNGDEVIATEAELYAFWEHMVAEQIAASSTSEVGESSTPLIVNRVSGRDDKWSATQARNLTYCVSKTSFGTRYTTVVNAMANATAAWEAIANVNFVHDSAKDGNCNASTAVLFDVRATSSQSYLARAFFPSTSRAGRNVIISTSSFGNIGQVTLTGVLRHELGHTLGFRHEHTRPEAGTCFENSSWRALTTYDSASVMHYPQCRGTNRGDLVLTTRDKNGAVALYP